MDTGQGFPEWAELISEKLNELDIYLEYVLLTHWHGDHSGGVPDLVAKYPHLVDRIYKHSPEGQQQPIEDGQTFGVQVKPFCSSFGPWPEVVVSFSDLVLCSMLVPRRAKVAGAHSMGWRLTAVIQCFGAIRSETIAN